MAAARASATGYRWDDGRILVNMDEGRKRLEHIRSDPRVALDVIDEGNWYTGNPYPRRDCGRITAWIAVDRWHGWGALKDSSQAG